MTTCSTLALTSSASFAVTALPSSSSCPPDGTAVTVSTAPNNAELGLGFEFVAVNGITFRAHGDVQTEVDTRLFTKFDLNDRLTSWSVTGGIGLPMSAFFGTRAGGSFNLDVATGPSASSGIAKLVLPLN